MEYIQSGGFILIFVLEQNFDIAKHHLLKLWITGQLFEILPNLDMNLLPLSASLSALELKTYMLINLHASKVCVCKLVPWVGSKLYSHTAEAFKTHPQTVF